ncbi:Gfo/Idh/MocA family oxidoreductase [Arachidicoccus sp.]|uniref:Gfo/Idh/MocA family oxidoreductase n=1 Tax=Arachidicoccus sp. TaxID=1872624 RepID=UPI003D21895F
MNQTKPIRTAMMAYGMSGKIFHAPFIHVHSNFELYAVVERTNKLAVLDYPYIHSFDSIEELLADNTIDLIIVNTPNYLHFEHAMAALKAGKHILIEKPICANNTELQRLFTFADEIGKKIFFYQNRRWDSDFLSVKAVIEAGKLGRVNEVHFRFDRYKDALSPKRFKEEPIAASGLLYDLGPHLLDQVISLWGKPLSWEKTLGKNRIGTKVDDYFSIHLSYPNSLNIFVHSNMMVADAQPAFILNGSNGSYTKYRTDTQESQLLAGIKPSDRGYGMEENNSKGKLVYFNEQKERIIEYTPSLTGNYLALFDALSNSLLNEAAFPISREEEHIQLEIISAERTN